MSDPISILGTALAVVSIAANLSIKLSEIVKTIKSAPREVAIIASEISLISSILHSVRETLIQGRSLVKPQLMADVGSILCRFGEVNSEVSSMIDRAMNNSNNSNNSNNNNKKKKMTKKMRKRWGLAELVVFKGRQVKELMAKVESLKLSMSLIMNTVILAATQDNLERDEKRQHDREEHMRVIRMIVHSGVENSRREIDKQQRSRKDQRTQAEKIDLQLRDHGNTAKWLYQLVFSPESRGVASEENDNAIPADPAPEQETKHDEGSGTLGMDPANGSQKGDVDMTTTGQKPMRDPENPEQKDLSGAEGDSFVFEETPQVVERLLNVWTYSQERREKASHEKNIHPSGRSNYHSASGDEHIGAPHSDSKSEESADEEFWDSVDDDEMDAPKRANPTSPRHFTARDSSSHAYRGTKSQTENTYGQARWRNYTPPPQQPPPPPELTPEEKEDMAQRAEHLECLRKLEDLLRQQAQAREDKNAAKKKAAEDAAAAEAKAKKKHKEDKLAKLFEILVALREEQKARDEAIAAARAVEKAEADARAAKDAAEMQRAAEDAANMLYAAEKAREEAEAKAAEDAQAAKEAHENALAEAAEELRQMKEEIERKAGAKVRPDFLSKLSRKWSSKGKGGV